MHSIQKYIIDKLQHTDIARFSDMKPPRVDSNGYSYHLKVLQKEGYVLKRDQGYTLSPYGLSCLDGFQQTLGLQKIQPRIACILVIRNQSDEILLYKNQLQPFIHSWQLPTESMVSSDFTVQKAADRIARQHRILPPEGLKHRGVTSIHLSIEGELVSVTLAHIFSGISYDDTTPSDHWRWTSKYERRQAKTKPSSEQIIEAVKSSQSFFYDEFKINSPL